MNDLITKRAITYSVLAHIKNSGKLTEGPLDVFIPLVKKCLHFMNSEKNHYKGANISEIRSVILEQYGIDFPLPVLKSIAQKIAAEVNSENEKVFELYKDGGFWIKKYIFEDYDEQLRESQIKVQELQKAFKEFCKINNVPDIDSNCIIKFIEKNRISMSRYLSHTTIENGENFTLPALFVNYFREFPNFYSQIRNLYLGSTITCALEYKFSETNIEVSLLFDTNFIVSLLDLNTPESTHTCQKLLEICKKIGYKFLILPETIDEIISLITFKSNNLDSITISKYVNKEDIFNACERRNLSKVDLERICDNLENTLDEYEIKIIQNTTSLKNKARYNSPVYNQLKKYRNTDKAALHDAMAIIYVKEKRGKNIREFEKVNCWFVNNSITHDFECEGIDTLLNSYNNNNQPEIIKADDLLNILWLSNPNINNSLANNDLVDIGLTTLVAYTLNESLPKSRIIKELDDNIQKYKSSDITDRDVYLLSIRITNNQVKNIESLNELAEKNSVEFNLRIKEEAKKQEQIDKERAERFEELYKEMETSIINYTSEKVKIEKSAEKKIQQEIELIKSNTDKKLIEKDEEIRSKDEIILHLKKEKIDKENIDRKKKKDEFIKKEIRKWRIKSWIWLGIFLLLLTIGIIWIFVSCKGDLVETNKIITSIMQNTLTSIMYSIIILIVNIFIFISLYDKYQNHSNIEAYTKKINIPDDLLLIEYDEMDK